MKRTKCPECNGTGEVLINDGFTYPYLAPCPACKATDARQETATEVLIGEEE